MADSSLRRRDVMDGSSQVKPGPDDRARRAPATELFDS
jgi:hypothetical protein